MIATAAAAEPVLPMRTATPVPTAVTEIHFSDADLKAESADPHYSINVLFPVFFGEDALNQFEVDLVNGMAASFVNDVQAAGDLAVSSDTYSSLQGKYMVHTAEKGLVSVNLQVSQFLVGAAHPNAFTMVINYDLKAANELKLEDVLAPGGLDFVSKYSTDALQKTGELQWMDGVAPAAENFKNWNFTPTGLVITFDPYQVNAYATGFHTVSIPYTDLDPYMTADTPLRRLLSPTANP
jgi:hypothetical protein